MRGAATMKMISSTSMTSTMGVTLMSERPFFPPPVENDMRVGSLLEEVPLDDVQEVRREVRHLRLQHVNLAVEAVEGHHRGDGGEEPHRGGDERVADGLGHRGQV